MRSPGSERGGRRRWPRRLAAVLLGLALAPLVVEASLRALALWVRDPRGGEAGASLGACQGDSYTYGLFLPSELAYPARLEAYLADGGVPAPRIVNLGTPGKPSWELRRELRRDLRAYRPRFVLLLAGVNDMWRRRPADHDVDLAGRSEWRIARTWQLLRHRFADDAPLASEGAVRLGPAHTRVGRRDREGQVRAFEVLHGAPDADPRGWIEEGMTRAVAIAREEGVQPVLLGYPSPGAPFEDVTEILRGVAEATGTPFVDFRPAVTAALRQVPADALFFSDRHARALGCDLMARVLVHRLHELGLVRVEHLPEVLGGLPAESGTPLRVEPDRAAGRPEAVLVRYRPDRSAVLLLSRSIGETAVCLREGQGLALATSEDERRAGVVVPLATTPLLERIVERWGGRPVPLDEDGAAGLGVPGRLPAGADGAGSIYACVVVLDPGTRSIEAVSDVLELPLF